MARKSPERRLIQQRARAVRRTPVWWAGGLVGWIENPDLDNFFVYGRWVPNNPHASRFAAIVNRGEEPNVLLGEPAAMPAHAMNVADGLIEVRFDVSPPGRDHA